MHELSLAQSVVDIVIEEAIRNRLRRIEKVRLRIGLLRGVVPELLRNCLQFAGKGTVAEGALVEIEEVSGKARCPGCGLTFDISELLFLCPKCETVGGEIVAGQELCVIDLEGE